MQQRGLAYADLDDKWIYFYGDVTMRPLATTFLLPNYGAPKLIINALTHS